MSVFSVSLGTEVFESEDDLVISGSLIIGDFKEDFHASLSYWDRNRYLSQWKEGLERLLRRENYSAVVTTMYDPSTANFIFWWVMYLIGNDVYIQNHVLFLDELDKPFDETDLYSFVPEREIQTEEGEPISEWSVSLSAIRDSLDSLN